MWITILSMLGAMILIMLTVMILVMVVLHRKPREVGEQKHRGTQGALFFMASRIIRMLLRIGVPLGPMTLLTVRGRKTGQPRTLPVDIFERAGRSFLVSTHGEGNANWVRNLRAAGTGTLTRGRRQRTISAVELSQEAAGSVLKDILGPRLALPVRGFVLRRTLAIAPDASLDEFIDVARLHPVFELS